MSTEMGIEQVLENWLGDGPLSMPDEVNRIVAGRIATQPQRRSMRRWRSGNGFSAYFQVGAAVAVVALIAVGFSFLPQLAPGVFGPAASPSASPTPIPTPSPTPTATFSGPDPTPGPTLGPELEPGTFTSKVWRPWLGYTVGPGWSKVVDDGQSFELALGDRAGLTVVNDVHPPCASEFSPDNPHAPADLVARLTSSDDSDEYDVVVTPTSFGGLDGYRIDGYATGSCGTFVVNWGDLAHPVDIGSGFAFYALDDGEGRTVAIYWQGEDPDARAEAETVALSMEFGVPAPSLPAGAVGDQPSQRNLPLP